MPTMGVLWRGLRRGEPFFEASAALGGVRKVRWAARGKGKSGGVRVIYYWLQAADRVHLLLIYGKGEQAELTAQDLRRVKELLEQIENE